MIKINPSGTFLALIVLSAVAWLDPRATVTGQNPPLGPGRKYTTVERVQLERLKAVHLSRIAYGKARHQVGLSTALKDFKAIMHAHAEDSTHTGGTRPEMLAAAKRTGVQVIMLTDHVRPHRDFINDSWRGMREGVLFIPGAEAEGFLVYPRRSIRNEPFTLRDEYIAMVRRARGNIFLSHVEERFDWPTTELDGLEIYNHHTDIKDERQFLFWLGAALTNPSLLPQIQNALAEYPMEFFGATQDYLTPIIEKWDRDLASHAQTGVAANDCHHNQGFVITVSSTDSIEVSEIVDPGKPRRVTIEQAPQVAEMIRGRQPGDILARLDFDPYDRSMSYVATHILASELSEESIRGALEKGRAYVAHDWLCDPTGFAFVARYTRTKEKLAVMGDSLASSSGLVLELEAPIAGTVRLFRDGKIATEVTNDRLVWPVTQPGVYRVEIWLTLDGELRPWIYSNPIRIRPE